MAVVTICLKTVPQGIDKMYLQTLKENVVFVISIEKSWLYRVQKCCRCCLFLF